MEKVAYCKDFLNVARTYINDKGENIYEEWNFVKNKWEETFHAYGMCRGLEDATRVSEEDGLKAIKEYTPKK